MPRKQRTFAALSIALVGDSMLNAKLALSFSNAGHQVLLADRQQPANPFIVSDNIELCSVEDAAEYCDFIIIAAPASRVREIAYWLGDVRNKVIIDLSPGVPDTEEMTVYTSGALKSITGAEHVVKALNLFGFERKFAPLFNGNKYQMVLSGDSMKAKEVARIIMREYGISDTYDFGGTDNLPLFDEVSRCCRKLIADEQMRHNRL